MATFGASIPSLCSYFFYDTKAQIDEESGACDGRGDDRRKGIMKRPTYKELYNKINDAREAVDQGWINMINPDAVASDALQLGFLLEDELEPVLQSLFDDLKPGQYVGRRPPTRSYENKIMASEMFAFRTSSRRFGCKVYLKFTLYDSSFWLISLHKNRNKGKQG